ncbi:MAG TPA: hypothetical protein VIO15_08950 [Bacteroidales bacterium]
MNNLIKTVCCFILLAAVTCIARSQSNEDLSSAFEKYFSELKAGKNNPVPNSITQHPNEAKAIELAMKYSGDTLSMVRAAAYYIVKRIGINSSNLNTRQSCVYYLILACKDKDSGNSGTAGEYLTQFDTSDFTPKSLDSLRSLVRSKPPHYETILKLTGFLDLQDMSPFIKETILASAKISKQTKWAGHLALARMGDTNEVKYCVERCKRIPVSDNVVYNLFPDMVYTRQKEALDYLIVVLNSNEKNCTSPNPDSEEKILCGYRVMEYLAPVVEGFPLKLDIGGDLVTDNYEGALVLVRGWFNNTPGYKIDKSKF